MCKDDQPAQQSSSSTTAPWSGAVPYLNQGLQGASSLYQSGGPQYYPGQTYAGSNPGYNAGISNLQNIGQTAANSTPGSNPSNSFFTSEMNGDYLKAGNPYFSQMADTVRANVLPGINAQFAGAGRGNSGLAARAAGQGLGDAIGGLAYQNYNNERQNQISGAGAASNIYDNTLKNQLSGANAQLLGGTTQQGLEQGYLTDSQNRWNYQQNQPQQNLQNFIRNITGQVAGTGQTSSTGTGTPAQPSFWNQLLAGGLGAASFFA